MDISDNSGLTIKKIEYRALAMTLVMAVLSLLAGSWDWVYGIIIGGTMAWLSLRSITRTAKRALVNEAHHAQRITVASGVVRQLIVLAVLGICYFNEEVSFIATVIGLFTVKIVIVAYSLSKKMQEMSLRGIERLREDLERRN